MQKRSMQIDPNREVFIMKRVFVGVLILGAAAAPLAAQQSSFENYYGSGQSLNVDDVGVWLYDGGIQLRMPLKPEVTSGISPFVQVGAGAIRYSSDDDDIA